MTVGNFNFRIAEIGRLDPEAIVATAHRELAAVRIPKWCPDEVCQHFTKQIAGTVGTPYDDEPAFRKIIGGAVYDAANMPEKLDEYANSAQKWSDEIRKVFSPFLSPIDRLRLELQERWPHGCQLQQFRGRPGSASLLRAFEDGGEARAHQDMTNWDIPNIPEALEFETQLSAVTYLGCPEKGGELELWDFGYDNKAEYDRRKITNDYGIDRKHIGEPAMSLVPRVGELIIFNARSLHAVSRVHTGKRSSQSTFIAFHGLNKPLSVFS